jgi:C4-dicarboxylate-specific signal transduction histidine kinase
LFARAGLLPTEGARVEAEVQLGLVSSATSALGLDLEGARALAADPALDPSRVVVAATHPRDELYLVAALHGAIPSRIALVELSRIMLPVLLSALAAAGLMGLLVYRLLRPSLTALAEIADAPRSTPEGLERPDAPNEVVEIAVRFRETTRMLRDARERAEAQRDELESMQASLIRASKLASVGRLAAGIAHEVGNPLAAVKGYLALMKDGLPEPQRSEALDRSVRELERIHHIVQKLLTYARTGTETETEAAPFELRASLDDALGLARGHGVLRGVEIVDRVPADGRRAFGHAPRFGQALINLLLNAGQALDGAAPRRILISLGQEDERFVVRVADTGPGIPEPLRESVFDPFFTTKGPGEGTGLGLAVSRAMMEAMGGSLELAPHLAPGASFVLHLTPAPEDDERAHEGASAVHAPPSAPEP